MARRMIVPLCAMMACWTAVCHVAQARGKKEPAVVLTAQGKKLLATYSQMLDSLKAEITNALPHVDQQKKTAFLAARAALASLSAPRDETAVDAIMKYKADSSQAAAKALTAARAILNDVGGFLASDKLDSKLMKAAILRNATPRGLAEFAQQGAEEKGILDKLFADDALMKQMLVAGGANGSEYGEAMQVYAAILKASKRARQRGSILQRLALGTALQQPWLAGKEKGGVYGIVRADSQVPGGQVARYLNYEKAYLAGELDPAFKNMNTWECRFITNDPYTNEELSWVRKMMRTYRPDEVRDPDYKWRYTRIVKSDVPYAHPTWDPSRGTKTQQIIAGGGECGPRAFFGRFVARAFGIPSRRETQVGHGAMNHWTPDGWTVCFGAWWSFGWCGPQGGLDFLLDSQARSHPKDYMQVLRAQWVGDALGQEDVSIRHGQYGKGGGFWDGLAFYKKRAIVEDAQAKAKTAQADIKLASLSAEQGKKLGESDEILDDEKTKPIDIPAKDKKITIDKDGVITIPAVACVRPINNTEKIRFMKSWDSGMQIHYERLGKRPELLQYKFEAPADGKYELTARVATVSVNQSAILRLNRRTFIHLPLPYTKGLWGETKPAALTLSNGKNTLEFTCRAPNRGVTIKDFVLTPVR